MNFLSVLGIGILRIFQSVLNKNIPDIVGKIIPPPSEHIVQRTSGADFNTFRAVKSSSRKRAPVIAEHSTVGKLKPLKPTTKRYRIANIEATVSK